MVDPCLVPSRARRLMCCTLFALVWAAFSLTEAVPVSAQLIEVEEEREVRHRIFAIGGIEYLGSRDDGGSPLRYEGYAYPLGLAYEREGERGLGRLESAFSHFGVNSGLLRASIADGERHHAEPTVVRLRYGYWRKLGQERTFRAMLGGEFNSTVFFRNYQYDPYQIGTVELWDGVNSLDLSARLRLQLSPRQKLVGRMALPVLGYVVRPSYAVRGDERLHMVRQQWRVITDGYWASWGRMQRIQAEVGYRLELTQRLGIEATYHFEFFRVTQPFVSRGVTSRYGLGLGLFF